MLINCRVTSANFPSAQTLVDHGVIRSPSCWPLAAICEPKGSFGPLWFGPAPRGPWRPAKPRAWSISTLGGNVRRSDRHEGGARGRREARGDGLPGCLPFSDLRINRVSRYRLFRNGRSRNDLHTLSPVTFCPFVSESSGSIPRPGCDRNPAMLRRPPANQSVALAAKGDRVVLS